MPRKPYRVPHSVVRDGVMIIGRRKMIELDQAVELYKEGLIQDPFLGEELQRREGKAASGAPEIKPKAPVETPLGKPKTVDELKALLKAKGLKVGGNKAALQKRAREAGLIA